MSRHNIILSADTPCDIGEALQARYSVSLYPLHILLDGKQYTDGKDIMVDQIYQAYWDKHVLPKTAAINPEEYASYFRPWVEAGKKVLHISLGSGLSCSCQNAKLAAAALGENVCVIDSCSLSTGFGHLVCEAGERIAQGMDFARLCEEISALAPRTRASFVLDTLEFLHAGGRCSALASFGANLLQIKPSIEVKNDQQGGMVVGKKYSGKFSRVVMKYVEEQLKDRSDIVLDRVFITYSTMEPALVEEVRALVLRLQPFAEAHVTRASCTIGSHCGPNCIGVLYIVK